MNKELIATAINKELEALGYCVDPDKLETDFQRGLNTPPNERVKDFMVGAAPFIISAFEAGAAGENISDVFPWIMPLESKKAV